MAEISDLNNMRIGIIGTGRIAARFVEESRHVDGVYISAIYNRHIESAMWFAENSIAECDGEMILTDEIPAFMNAVDAVYIATPHETHMSYVMMALEYGKHVLCEKPMSLNKEQLEEAYKLAKNKKLVCMEAIKTAYCPGFKKLIEIVRSGSIGTPRDIDAAFTKIGSAAGREMWTEYGGSFVELGSYVLIPVMKLYGTIEKPQINTFSLAGAPEHDSYTKMMLTYGNRVATVKTGLGVKSEGELIISGDRGYIRVPSPWWLTKRIEIHHENPNQVEIYENSYEGSGLRYELAEFVSCVGQDKTENDEKCGVSEAESMWLADMIHVFHEEQLTKSVGTKKITEDEKQEVRIWAHRGCSMEYPENTLLAFKRAAEIKGLTGIELDTQLTKDDEIVVIHDERVDRTTDGSGNVCDFTLDELRKLHITGSGQGAQYILSDTDRAYMGMKAGEELHIPTLREVFEIVKPYCERNGLRINIELKNSVVSYEGMEKKVVDLVREYGLSDYIVYSSFNHTSLQVVRNIEPKAKTGVLAGDYHDCLDGFYKYNADAIHPWNCGMPVNMEDVINLRKMDIPVRVYNGSEPLYGQCRRLPDDDLRKYGQLGMTDLFTNVPERYIDGI